jgi:hypothetical protein
MGLKDIAIMPIGHAEPDSDQAGGPSDADADNLPDGALDAYQAHLAAEAKHDASGAASALANFVRIVMAAEDAGPEPEGK